MARRNKRNSMLPASGKLYDSSGNVVDLTSIITNLNSIMNSLNSFTNGLENETKKIVTIDTKHEKIHNGDVFYFSSIFTVPAEDEIVFGMETGNKYIHMFPPNVVTDGPNVEIRSYENSSFNGGVSVKDYILNRNRSNNKETSLEQVKSGINVVNLGDEFYPDYIPGGTGIGGSSYGGANLNVDEVVLDINSYYIFKFLNLNDENVKIRNMTMWYETDQEVE